MRSSRVFWILAVTTAMATAAVGTSGCASERVSGATVAEATTPGGGGGARRQRHAGIID